MALLQLKNIYYESNHSLILKGLNLDLEPHEIFALVGTNGTGKTTLARLIMGCAHYVPTRGEVLFDGRDITNLSVYERSRLGITLTWQEPARFDGIEVRDYLCLKNHDLEAGQFLKRVGLAPDLYLHRMMDKNLSGGERKRIELASVLALNPRLVILDEPAEGIDLLSLQEIKQVILSFKDIGASVLLITHLEEMVYAADRAAQICDGTIIRTGTPREVAARYKNRPCSVCDGKECVDV